MLFSILIGVVIFAYAAFTLIRFVKKSREGQCASCALKDHCNTASCCAPDAPSRAKVAKS